MKGATTILLAVTILAAWSVPVMTVMGTDIVSEDVSYEKCSNLPLKDNATSPERRSSIEYLSVQPYENICLDARDAFISTTWSWKTYRPYQYGAGCAYIEKYDTFGYAVDGWLETRTYMNYNLGDILDRLQYLHDIMKVELVLTAENGTCPGDVGVYRATSPWSFGGNFTTPYGFNKINQYPGPITIDRSKAYDVKKPDNLGQKYRWNITELFKEWMDGDHPNFGICLAMTDPPAMNDPQPGPSEPDTLITTFTDAVQPSDTTPKAPCLYVTYTHNSPPAASIDSVTPSEPVEGVPTIIKGSGSDADGDGIAIYKWWTDEGLVESGPGANEINMSFTEGSYTIYLAVKDDDLKAPAWSKPVSMTLIVGAPRSQGDPVVSAIGTSSNGSAGSAFPEGSLIDVVVTEKQGIRGLCGTITIRSNRVWVNRENLTDNDDGTYGYTWDSGGVPPGVYSVDVTLENPRTGTGDLNGLVPGIDLELTLKDITPPVVEEVFILEDIPDGGIQPGHIVTIRVKEENLETGCIGTLNITGPMERTDLALSPAEKGYYSYKWDTFDWPQGDYSIDVLLKDSSGNSDPDGSGSDPDLTVTIYDSEPPRVFSVISVLDDGWVHIKVQEGTYECDLYGTVSVNGPESLTVELECQGNGWYEASVNTTELEPGIYEVEVQLWDDNGNVDEDGLPDSPDTTFMVESRDPRPYVTEIFPEDRQVIDDPDTNVNVVFSEAVSFDGDLKWALCVWSSDGQLVEGNVILEGDGTSMTFVPEESWRSGRTYSVYVSPDMVDMEGGFLNSSVHWIFSVASSDPPRVLSFSPLTDPIADPRTPVEFNVSFSNLDDVVWKVDGEQRGNGNTFTFESEKAGSYDIEATGNGPGGDITLSWEVTVLDEAAAGDDTGVDDSVAGEVKVTTETAWTSVAVLGSVVVLMFLILIMQFVLKRKKPSGRSNGMAGGKNDGNVKGGTIERRDGEARAGVVVQKRNQPGVRTGNPPNHPGHGQAIHPAPDGNRAGTPPTVPLDSRAGTPPTDTMGNRAGTPPTDTMGNRAGTPPTMTAVRKGR